MENYTDEIIFKNLLLRLTENPTKLFFLSNSLFPCPRGIERIELVASTTSPMTTSSRTSIPANQKSVPPDAFLLLIIFMFNLLNHFFGVVFDFFYAFFDLFDFVGHGEAVDGDGEEDADEDVEDTEDDIVDGGV